ncbi:MAG: hypothetical protein PUC37_04845 [Spirochaetales bacterium]|nr:hypothetical protein [Spirochaetales bacterium]
MKRFFLCLLILAVFFSAIFFVGWTQFRIKPGFAGVVVSKTGGISQTPVQNGVFSWYKEFLLPSNAQLVIYSIEPLNISKTISGALPSSQYYSELGKDYNFSYSLEFNISLTVSAEGLCSLMKDNIIKDQESLNQYIGQCADLIAQRAADYYLKKAAASKSFRPEQIRREDLYRSLKLYEECPWIELSVFSVTSYEIPDFELYEYVRNKIFSDSKDSINTIIENSL